MQRLLDAELKEEIISENKFIILQQYTYAEGSFILLLNLYLNEILTFSDYFYAGNYLCNTTYSDDYVGYLLDIDKIYTQLIKSS